MDDPRLTPARPDLAALYLKGKVDAARFVAGETYEIADPIAALRDRPAPDGMLSTQALKGERVTVYDRDSEGWAWGQLNDDGYVGWLAASSLGRSSAAATHRITAIRTFAFPGPSIKLPPLASPVMGARLTVTRHDGDFAVTREGWYLPQQHLGTLDRHEADFVEIAERFIGTPYLWGGKSSLGIDCSGLVQLSLNAAGTGCPRDSDMQQQGLGRALDSTQSGALQRGDLIFWKGHVAIVRDADTIIHANAHHMATAIENTRDAIARIKATGSDVTSIKRL